MMYPGQSSLSLQIFVCVLIGCGPSPSTADFLHLSHTTYTGVEGSRAEVTCTASVREIPQTLKWTRQDQNPSQKTDESKKSVKLVIPSLRRDDPGMYTCILVTASGEEETAEVVIHVSPKNSEGQTCKINQFKCKKTKDCIFRRYRCDGKDDCGDGSDEECPGNPCANKFICNNSRCVDHAVRCNHVDNCEDGSDEKHCSVPNNAVDKFGTTGTPSKNGPGSDDGVGDHHGSVRSTIYTIIASTTLLVILISIVIILVFRAKMKRLRQRRTVQTLLQMYRVSNDSHGPMAGEEGYVEHQPFLPQTSQGFHQGPSIIFNVNNGVQYMSRHRFVMDTPPPYSEVQDRGGGDEGAVNDAGGRVVVGYEGTMPENTPPPYSTLDRISEQLEPRQQLVNQGRSNQAMRNPNAVIDEDAEESEEDNSMQRGISDRSRNGRDAYPERHSPSVAPGTDAGIGRAIRPRDDSYVDQHHLSHPASRGSVAGVGRGQEPLSHQLSAQDYSRGAPYGGGDIDINPYFLQHLLVSHSSRPSANGCGTSESSSHGSGASSSSSSGEDSLYNDEHGMTSASGIDVHDAGTLCARDLPCDVLESVLPGHGVAVSSSVAAPGHLGFLEERGGNREPQQPPSNQQPLTGTTSGQNPIVTGSENSHIFPTSRATPSERDDVPSPTDSESQSRLHQQGGRTALSGEVGAPLNPSASVKSAAEGAKSGNASSALLEEVARIDERNKPKQGHLSVHRGQIVLHTSDGVLAGQSIRPEGPTASQGGEAEASPPQLSGEIIVKDGRIMLQIPVGRSLVPEGHVGFPCMESIGLDRKSPTLSAAPADNLSQQIEATPERGCSGNNSEITCAAPTSHAAGETEVTQQPSPGRFGGDLNIRNGELVLEPARHTPSSQLLAHLQDAYIQEERQETSRAEDREGTGASMEPVVNDKRTSSSATPHRQQPSAKCNSDIVLPRGKR